MELLKKKANELNNNNNNKGTLCNDRFEKWWRIKSSLASEDGTVEAVDGSARWYDIFRQ